MGLFSRSKPEAPKTVFHDQNEILEEVKQFAIAEAPKSSTLTPHELYLLQQSGYEPIQVVFGNVVYSMGLRGLFRSFTQALYRGEMVDYSKLNEEARLLARNRMLAEATDLGADAVVGVEIHIRELYDFMEINATGTAVKRVSDPIKKEPVVSV